VADLSDALGYVKAFEKKWQQFNTANFPTLLELIEVQRDYGMEVRGQAPQFFRAPRNPNAGRSSYDEPH
jgi:hypothetical protein